MIETQLTYIDENLDRIIKNPDAVLYLRPSDVGRKKALFAMVKEEPGVYSNLQITKEQSKWTFPFEPIYYFYNGPGRLYLKDFIIFRNWLALNSINVDGFRSKTLDWHKIANLGIFATYNDGTASFVERKPPKEFEKNGGIQAYIDLLKQHKEYNPQHEYYQILDFYDEVDNKVIIPELQENVEGKAKIKTLTKDIQKI